LNLKEDDILLISDAAKLTKRSPGAIRNMVMRRKIPFRKVAGRLVFIRPELLRWIEDAPGVRLTEVEHERP